TVRLADLLSKDLIKLVPGLKEDLDSKVRQVEEATGIKAADVERVTAVLGEPSGLRAGLVRTAKPYGAEKRAAAVAPGAEPRKEGAYTVYASNNGPAVLAVIDGRTFAAGEARELTGLLHGRAGEGPAAPEEATELLAGKHLVAAGLSPID